MRLVSYLRPSKQAAAGEEAAAGRVSGLSACAAAGLSYFEQCPLSYARLCVDLCVQVSPQTRQIACKIFVDFCHVVLVGLRRRSACAKRGQNLFQLRMIQRIRPSGLLSVRQNPEQLHSDPSKQCRGQFLQHFLLIFCKALFVFFVPKCRILCTAVSCTHVAFQRSQSRKNL